LTDKKIVINHTGENLLIGSHFHKLNDESVAKYTTDNIPIFFEYLKQVSVPFQLFYNLRSITAIPDSVNRYGDELAILSLINTDAFCELRDIKNNTSNLEGFEHFLNAMKPYMDSKGLELLSNLRDFKVNKIQKVVRQKNRQTGEFNYQVKQESAGNDDFNPPAQLMFSLPMFRHIPDLFKISMDFEFSFRPLNEEVHLKFTLSNIQFEELEEVRHKEILDAYLKKNNKPFFWGEYKTVTRNDCWSFMKNELQG